MILVGAAREYFTIAEVVISIFQLKVSVIFLNLVSLNSSKHCVSSQIKLTACLDARDSRLSELPE